MQLRDYRKWRGLTLAQVAALTGQSVNNVSRQERGLQRVDAAMREKYREVTKGRVKASDWHRLELNGPSMIGAASPKRKEAAHA